MKSNPYDTQFTIDLVNRPNQSYTSGINVGTFAPLNPLSNLTTGTGGSDRFGPSTIVDIGSNRDYAHSTAARMYMESKVEQTILKDANDRQQEKISKELKQLRGERSRVFNLE